LEFVIGQAQTNVDGLIDPGVAFWAVCIAQSFRLNLLACVFARIPLVLAAWFAGRESQRSWMSVTARFGVAVKIRLKRFGRKNRAFWRINAIDSRSPRDGKVLEELGFYDPLSQDPATAVVVNKARVAHWMERGALPSPSVAGLLKRATDSADAAAALAQGRADAKVKAQALAQAQLEAQSRAQSQPPAKAKPKGRPAHKQEKAAGAVEVQTSSPAQPEAAAADAAAPAAAAASTEPPAAAL
jgi:small subunit ribosomal protein S16